MANSLQTISGSAVRRTGPVNRSVPAGYDPDALDNGLTVLVREADRAVRHVEVLSAHLERVLASVQVPSAPTLKEAGELSTIHERQTKAALNLVKCLDELTRLRSFLAGGPDSRPDLTVRGELELKAIVLQAVESLGWKVQTDVTDAEVIP